MSVVMLARAKTHLNITVSTHDGELQDIIEKAESLLAKKVGPLASTATTARVQGGDSQLVLPVTPAISLTSVTPVGGTALTVGDLYVSSGGIVEYADGSGYFGDRVYTVVYTAGRATLPEHLEMAILELVRHTWTTQRGPTARAGIASEQAANSLPGAAYAFPFRVEQLIAHDVQVGI